MKLRAHCYAGVPASFLGSALRWLSQAHGHVVMRRHGAPLLEDESSSRRCTSAVIEMVCTHRNVSACLCSLSSLSGGGALGVLVLVVLRWPASGTHACGECNDGTPRSAKLWLLTPPLWRMSINAERRIRASLASARATGAARASNVHPHRVWPRAPLPQSFEGWGRLRKVRFWSWPTHR